MSSSAQYAQSLEFIENVVAGLPSELERVLEVELPDVEKNLAIVTTGIGASEGPARILASLVSSSGRNARFIALSELRAGIGEGSCLVSISQGLSPNARLSLRDELSFEKRLLLTSIGFGGEADARHAELAVLRARGIETIVIPPAKEGGTLARLRGPTIATLAVLRLAHALGALELRGDDLKEAPARYAHHSREGIALRQEAKLALVTSGLSVEAAFGPRWKLLETLLLDDPPIWDVLSFGHGPSQAMTGRALTLLALETPSGSKLVDRLAESIDRDHHRLVRLRSSTDGPLSVLDHLAAIDACLLETLRKEPRDLFDWPSRGRECALYTLGSDDT